MRDGVVVVIGIEGIELAIARRQGPGRSLLLADPNSDTLDSASTELKELGHQVTTQTVDVSSHNQCARSWRIHSGPFVRW
jgi:hypothetical protein